MSRRSILSLVAASTAALALTACGTTSTSGAAAPAASAPAVSTSAPATTSSPTTQSPSGYVSYADYSADPAAYSAGPVVLFFHADWCPKCRETDSNLTADPASLPKGLTVVKLDFDTETALRQQYGVTVQHTFVQIDAAGEKIGAWTGTYTGSDIAGKVV
jgi:thioredoxin 1